MSTQPSLPQPRPEPKRAPGPEPADPRRAAPKRRRGWIAVSVGAAALAAWLWSNSAFSGGGAGAAEEAVRTVAVARSDLHRTLRIGGTIAARRFAAIRAPRIRSGRRTGGGGGGGLTLVSMAEPGSFVDAGAVVAEFDRQRQEQRIDDQRAGVAQAEAAIDRQKANLMIAMEGLKQQLVDARGVLRKAELDLRTVAVRSEIEAEILKAQKEEAEATAAELEAEVLLLEEAQAAVFRQVQIERDMQQVDLRRAELNAERLRVTSPIAGIVVLQTIFRGGTFSQTAVGDQVNSGTFFMQVVDPRDMVLKTLVNQADVQLLRVGQSADVRLDAYPDRVWRGRVESIAAMTGGGSTGGRSRSGAGNYVRNVAVEIDILDSDTVIIPDLSASADVLLEAYENVVAAPREALLKRGEEWYVWLSGDVGGEPERRAVEVGAFNDTHVAVLRGLEEGDRLAVRESEGGESR